MTYDGSWQEPMSEAEIHRIVEEQHAIVLAEIAAEQKPVRSFFKWSALDEFGNPDTMLGMVGR